MAKQVGKKIAWVINNFSSLQSKKCYSVPFLIGDCKWRLCAYPKGDGDDYFSLFLQVANFESLPSGCRIYAHYRLTVVSQLSSERNVLREAYHWFDQESSSWGFSIISLTKLHDEEEGFLENGSLEVVAEVDVLEVIGTLDESEESREPTSPLKKKKLNDDGVDSNGLVSVKESMDVKGFQVPPSKVESVRRIFERHPDIVVEFRSKNQYLRNACMNFLLSLIETLCQSLEELSDEDLVEADIALTYVKDAGFKVDWLEEKLEQVKEKKEKEQSGLARLKEMGYTLLILKQKCSELDALVEKEEAELSVTRTPLSFDAVV